MPPITPNRKSFLHSNKINETMKIINYVLSAAVGLSFVSNADGQESEWLVELETTNGSFNSIGESLYDDVTLFLGTQCKDEINGQFIFITADNPNLYVTVDITTAEIVDETPSPTSFVGNWGFHCYGSCDSLIMYRVDEPQERNFLAFFDRVNGTSFEMIGDSIPDDDPSSFSTSHNYTAFDRENNLLYANSAYSDIMRVFQIPSGELINVYQLSETGMTFISFDEVNGNLYGIEFLPGWGNNLRLLKFDFEAGDFSPVGEPFESISQAHISPPTIDGNQEIMYIMNHDNALGSFLMKLDLNTGELLLGVQTIPGPDEPGLFGGANLINGQFFNSTDQLIALHWGPGFSIVSTEFKESNFKLTLYPNPSKGAFRIQFGEVVQEANCTITDLKGRELLSFAIRNTDNYSFDSDLPAGIYLLEIMMDGAKQTSRLVLD